MTKRSLDHLDPLAIERLAYEFAAALRVELGDETFNRVRCRNLTVLPGTCASHDFCDANMVMLAAVATVLGVDEDDVDIESEAFQLYASAAWNVAHRQFLTENPVR